MKKELERRTKRKERKRTSGVDESDAEDADEGPRDGEKKKSEVYCEQDVGRPAAREASLLYGRCPQVGDCTIQTCSQSS